jgi:hypothetical protein
MDLDYDPEEDAVCLHRGVEYYEHEWSPGDPECRRCGADLWNDEECS